MFALSLSFGICTALGCGDVNSTIVAGMSTKDGTTCYLHVNNQSISDVAETFADALGAPVLLADGIDGEVEVSRTIKADSWEQGLEVLASGLDLRVEHDEATQTYTLIQQ
jgi:ferric-dicitrate binding protein FerR (iron transport regulator)